MVSVCSPAEALAHVQPGDTVMVGGFGLVGAPLTLIAALLEADGARDLTIVSNNLGEPGRGLGKLLPARRVRKAIGSYFTSNREVVEAHLRGEIEVELLPQGTLAESIRAGGAGIGAFYVRTGAGTLLAEGKEERIIDGERYLLQFPLKGDVALIRAHKADKLGNLAYLKTARNFNPDMATAAKTVIAEVDEIVEVGELSPEEIATPHLFVDHLVRSEGVSA
ncbi:CoA transferase subunit A [Conexibacter arvalis]|uniref:3-oxoacid CoA-transferase subunit A/3-oxoadipate CoA-transferase alpha subunit n=1 Tax=Conexibacter arvalis TaxID=912552 RepID=A0A840IMJ6_9ACTN|nr:CoA transferase subunit A [Conexibacter arvalis]MBB4665188.1 3-oxoacid CoA-transferase subunit A/3-oxoadipate CoA-transferase alpha subunit [Conexibacter arvalis]